METDQNQTNPQQPVQPTTGATQVPPAPSDPTTQTPQTPAPNTQTQPPQTPVEQPPPTPQEPTPTTPKKSKMGLVIFLIVFLLLIVAGAVGFFFYQNNFFNLLSSPSPTPVPIPIATPYTPPVPTATPDPTADWKVYNNESFGISFKYPSSWKVTSLDSPIFRLNIEKEGFLIDVNKPDGWSPSICEYLVEDTQELQTAYFDEYEDIKTADGLLRRSRNSSYTKQTWYICVKKADSEKYTTILSFGGSINFKLPEGYKESDLKEMDQILSTFKFSETTSEDQTEMQ